MYKLNLWLMVHQDVIIKNERTIKGKIILTYILRTETSVGYSDEKHTR